MLESILAKRNVSTKAKITIKSLISAGLIILAVGLPQLVHLIAGASGGMTWLPMYLPVLIAGCLLGKWWGLGIGITSPIVSFLFTSFILGSPMPALIRLPFMVCELAVFGLVTGLFSKKIMENHWIAFPAVLAGQLSGRAVFITLVAIFQSVSGLSVATVWGQIVDGLAGIVLQAVLVPIIIIGLELLLERKNEK